MLAGAALWADCLDYGPGEFTRGRVSRHVTTRCWLLDLFSRQTVTECGITPD